MFIRLFFLFICLLPSLLLAEEVRYRVEFRHVPHRDLLVVLQNTGELEGLRKYPPTSVAALRNRAEESLKSYLSVLHSFGYYDAQVEVHYIQEADLTRVIVELVPGPVYRLSSFEVVPVDAPLPTDLLRVPDVHYSFDSLTPQDLGLRLWEPAEASKILQSKERLLSRLSKEGYPLAIVQEEEIFADQTLKTLSVTFRVNTGPLMQFGEVNISGLEQVNPSFVRQKFLWCLGDRFDPNKLFALQRDLEQSQVFNSVRITYPKAPPKDSFLPIHIALSERKHRTIATGVSYRTDRGLGVVGEWEHRNIRGLGERLSLHGELRNKTQRGAVSYRKPDWLAPGLDFLLVSEAKHEKTKNFDVLTFSTSGLLEWQVNPYLRFFSGATIKQQETRQSDNNKTHTLFVTPMGFHWTTADDPLDPTRGMTAHYKLTPHLEVTDDNIAFLKQWWTGTIYTPLLPSCRWIFAGKLALGSLLGQSLIHIPPPDRFYAGGESLLRGYTYQTVSPLNSSSKPLGGRSLFVGSLELRWRGVDRLGWVFFFDFGNTYEEVLPHLGKPLLKSTGVGVRYRTPIGPLRVDLAFPLDRRPHLDSSYEVYLSIGQAF